MKYTEIRIKSDFWLGVVKLVKYPNKLLKYTNSLLC